MTIGKLLIIAGVVLLIIGIAITYAPWLANWFGKLPGDIRIEDKKIVVFVPITSMLIVSIILTLIINFFSK
jgi:Zn-dependent protease with chaperone function